MPEEFPVVLIKVALVAFVLITAVAYVQYVERRVMAFMQSRLGPNRVGPMGLLQPLADILKLIFKEDMIPAGADVPQQLAIGSQTVAPQVIGDRVGPDPVAVGANVHRNHAAATFIAPPLPVLNPALQPLPVPNPADIVQMDRMLVAGDFTGLRNSAARFAI